LNNSDLWVANLDGSDQRQLTTDGTDKSSLAWTPDGQGITYITAKCIHKANLEDGTVEDLACFNYVDSINHFGPSPDGLKAAITLDKQLYLIPYDLEGLKQAQTRGDIAAMAECKEFAPYLKNFITMVRWSADSQVIAAELIANMGNGLQGNIIQLFRIDQCIPNPRAIDNFPPPRFDMEGYDERPLIQNYTWDGGALFALNTDERNDGYGHLYVYHSELHKAYPKVNPIDNQCCYRDPQFSPDGTYLLFAYQDAKAVSALPLSSIWWSMAAWAAVRLTPPYPAGNQQSRKSRRPSARPAR
jgi:dipeptidyl aminopeptidase/acylaminoacyl peptidase